MKTDSTKPQVPKPEDLASDEPYKIGLFGYGCVGQGLYHLIDQLKHAGAEVVRIGIKDGKKSRDLTADRFTLDKTQILNDPTIQLVVEVIDDAAEAYRIVREALIAGRKVVSANKKMLAENLPELISLQHDFGGTLLYEAAVCGSIPVIRTIEDYYADEPLIRLSGILNGSSNYILSKVFSEGVAYSEALQSAQQLGFAETDPTLDVGGFDARYKLCLLAAHAFGVLVKPEQVLSAGIHGLNNADLEFARSQDKQLRLVATAERVGTELALFVMPQLLDAHQLLRGVENEFNAVVIEGSFSGPQFYRGKGAGSHPTASAVWADVKAAARSFSYGYEKLKTTLLQGITNDLYLPVYLRANETIHRHLTWEQVEHRSIDTVQGIIGLKQLVAHQKLLQEQKVFVALNGNLLRKDPISGVLQAHQSEVAELIPVLKNNVV
ncbi:MAG: homoserine dehydrogenase [Salibacteraceae bacterium]